MAEIMPDAPMAIWSRAALQHPAQRIALMR